MKTENKREQALLESEGLFTELQGLLTGVKTLMDVYMEDPKPLLEGCNLYTVKLMTDMALDKLNLFEEQVYG